MKLQVYFLYRTDEHLSTGSKELLFIGNLPNCMKAARKFNATDTQINELGYQKQSQLNNVTYYYSEGGCIVGKYLHEKGYGETY